MVLEKSVSEDDELPHDGGEGDLRGFAGVPQPVVAGLEVRIEADRDERRHGEGASAAPSNASTLRMRREAWSATVSG